MDIKTIIQKKRTRGVLSEEEFKYFISKFVKGEIAEAQSAALMSYTAVNGMNEEELYYFAKAMAESGETLDLSDIAPNIVDKHSTGGVGDKVTLILIPVIAALGLPVAKISSRGFGISGGTIDKLESIPGFNADIGIDKFKSLVRNVNCGIITQNFNLAPAESKMYRLRNLICCEDSLPIIAASLMSLKLSTGANKIVFDITCGRGTYIKTRDDARKLAKLLILLGKKFGKDVACAITSMDEPLGYSVGHTLEVQETILALQGKMPEDLGDVVVTLGTLILNLVTGPKNKDENAEAIKEVLRNGKALEKFKEMVKAEGGDVSYIDNPEKFPKAKNIIPVYAVETGTIEGIDADMVGSIAIYIGAGRIKGEQDINNKTAGIVLNKKIGDSVSSGEVLAYIHTDDDDKVKGAVQNLKDAFRITTKKVQRKPRVMETIM